MKCLILAAGYATRLYPLTENFPKPLLDVGGKTILDWLLEDLNTTGAIDGNIVVTNHKFADIFRKWCGQDQGENHPCSVPIQIVDDGTTTNEARLGAVKDIQFAIEQLGIDDDLLVMAGDNLLTFKLGPFIEYFRQKGTSCVMRYYEPELARLRKTGVLQIDEEDRIVAMEEKPSDPKSHWCCPPFYIYKREDLKRVPEGIAAGCGTDAPGSFIAWLCTKTPVHAWLMPGERIDIGSLASYEEAQKKYSTPSPA